MKKERFVQLYALDCDGTKVHALKAHKQTNYTCLECGDPVRLRSGLLRRGHFFHLGSQRTCGLSHKSIEHIQVQEYLLQQFEESTCTLEKPFPRIARIADVVWETEKLIFEVQCSPISPEEIEARNKDYLSEGYTVIWIFHDKRFNKRNVSAAEIFLRDEPYYYTNINKGGTGIIYDQFSSIQGNKKHKLSSPLVVNLTQVFWQHSSFSTPHPLLYFSGDCIEAKLLMGTRDTPHPHPYSKNPYLILFRYFLEKASS